MRRFVYDVACSVDGFIARDDGSFDFFLPDGEHFAYLLSELEFARRKQINSGDF